MKCYIEAQFYLTDPINPQLGYTLRIETYTGHNILFTSVAPDTGCALLSSADCVRVIAMYTES